MFSGPHRRSFITIAALWSMVIQTAIAVDIAPTLSTVPVRGYDTNDFAYTRVQTVPVEQQGTRLHVAYDSPSPFRIIVHFPTGGATLSWNPLYSLKTYLPAGQQDVFVDLRKSPAWSPARQNYLISLQAPKESGEQITISTLEILGRATIAQSLTAFIQQLFTPEPPLLSSIVFLYGYRVAGHSVTLVFGSMILSVCILLLLLRRQYRIVCTVLLTSLFAYDGLFLINQTNTFAADANEWIHQGMFRQLSALPQVSNALRIQATQETESMSVAVCSNEKDLTFRWLRYQLYPIPVERAEDAWDTATDAVYFYTNVSQNPPWNCTQTKARDGTMTNEFPNHTSTVHFTSPPS